MRVTLARAARSMRQTDESKQFFFAKKNQKTLVYKALALPRRVRQMDKSFCFFFFKKKCFLPADASASRQPGITSFNSEK
jgi:hypothetical protein